ncbi:hypothetical protein Mal15_06890 [Stieleria maiorica]|uniref:HTTM domain-containing protein n=1 Tax=Stieleria maiorica TaxID=2795974 RepID=A0A5B9M698_9BACT|nr:hypothetical protein [Stieleria maiorica]QEF96661.1 hypothetical protein Mal15_06890 [Stieleria maiorica]
METAVPADQRASDREAGTPIAGRVLWAYLIVQIGVFGSLAWKYEFFMLADQVYHRLPLLDPFFPAWLQSAEVVRWAYLGSLAAIILGVFGVMPWLRISSALGQVGCLGVMLVHQASHNDMTFATSLWASIWVFWFTTRMDRDEPNGLLRRAAFLSRAIASMILLGGAVGKWTPEYWSGEVFFDIYFLDRDFWVFNYLRETYDAETLRGIATWYSRKVIVVETLFGFGLWLFPPKWAAAIGVAIFFSIAFFSNHLLYSVLLCLVGLSSVGFFVAKAKNDT